MRDTDSPFAFRHCNGEGRFGLVSVIDRTKIGFSGFGLNEGRVIGMIFLAVVNIQVQTGYPHVLPPRRVEMPYIRDSGNVAEQSEVVLLSLLTCQNRVVEGVLDRSTRLSLDFFNELLDFGRRGNGLFALDSCQSRLVLAKRKIKLHDTTK